LKVIINKGIMKFPNTFLKEKTMLSLALVAMLAQQPVVTDTVKPQVPVTETKATPKKVAKKKAPKVKKAKKAKVTPPTAPGK
jgi:hypothetical protein